MKGAKKMTFSDYFFERRVQLGFTLRKFSQATGYDVGYISRIENGLMTPPETKEKLILLAKALEIKIGSKEWIEFSDLAAAARGDVPDDLKKDEIIVRFLPAFYRTLRSKKMSKEDIDKLEELLTGSKEEASQPDEQNTLPKSRNLKGESK